MKRPYWYRIHIECPVCGRSREERERVYGRKPEAPEQRYKIYTTACWDHWA